jgi:xanthine dehydrogenase YagS FAD-binding subunit
MIPFTFARASSADDAVRLFREEPHSLLGGGTNIVDLMRKGVERPARLVDVTALSQAIAETDRGGLMIGAAARNSAVAGHRLVRERYPMLSRAILAGASTQIRNMATVAGNIMQRTRCAYFADVAGSRCNKRLPGNGCDALGGFNRYHAVLGTSPDCIATHASDMCVALAALDASIHVVGPTGSRVIPVVDFYLLPGERPDLETALEHGEVITAIELPASCATGQSTYRKVRDRASYAFALVSIAAGVTMRDGAISEIRLAFGGVGTKPWRAFRAEAALVETAPERRAFEAAVAAEFEEARPQAGNAFKIELAIRTSAAVLAQLTVEKR